jgi:glycosyltransferase involved in cell wall biosynthesis
MRAAMRGLLDSPLAERYQLDVVATHTGTAAVQRLSVFLAALLRLTWWSLRGRGRVVHVHATVRGSAYRKAVCVLLASLLGRRVVLHFHSGPGDVATFSAGLSGWRGAFLRRALGRADVVLAVSSASAEQLHAGLGLGDIEVVPNAAPPVAATAAAELPGEPLAVFLGGFANPVKGGREMLAALAELPAGTLTTVLAGPGDLPPEGEALLVERPELSWRGWLEAGEREELMGGASIFVLASTSEGLPMALLEAMSRGQAIVATAVGGVPDVVGDGAEALVVAPGDTAALAAALTRVAADRELRRRLGAAARRRAAGLGDEAMAARIDAIYQRLLGDSVRPLSPSG